MQKIKYIEPTLDFDKKNWPENYLFPLNLKVEKRTVLQEIKKDLTTTSNILIVTGFTSLSFIIDFFGREIDFEKVNQAKIILGFYPLVHKRKYWNLKKLPDEVKEEWLTKGVSIFNGGGAASIEIIELIKKKKIKFKFSNKLHAKIYVSDDCAVLGSSNFSKNGLEIQKEANIRIEKKKNEICGKQYEDIKQIGNNFYDDGIDFTKEIIKLLEQLLAVTSWEETLARAINEILEGNAVNDNPELLERINNNSLWPSQKTAIGRALNILHEHQNVLIAEPTGSGKTKVISTLNVILTFWLNETGRRKLTQSLVICPPLVLDKWNKEFLRLSFNQPSIRSHGTLNNPKRDSYKEVMSLIKISNLLIIDEAHNYLNNKSIRSNTISKSSADNIILATATPINKRAKDLLRLIELLDVDNLTDDELKTYKELKKLPNVKKQTHLHELEKFIWKFTVRRTKKELTELINKEPDKYKDINNKLCSYPKHNKKIYVVKESENDKIIAKKINEELNKLKGIINLQEFECYPDDSDDKIAFYFEKRLKAAKALAIYKVQEPMRSSKIALLEHIAGTDEAKDFFNNIKISKTEIEGAIQKLKSLEEKALPKFKNISPKQIPYIWLKNTDEYIIECENEILIYKSVLDLAKTLSEEREISKLKKIISLAKHNEKILAYDHTIITLDYLKHKLSALNPDIVSFVVTGNSKTTSKNKILDIFSLKPDDQIKSNEYANKNVVAFCSDSMSDSVDLQKAVYLVFLDMPSVLRIAEQRIGRFDRLDSPHEEITVFGPKDSPEFALKTDRKLIRTLDITEALIGTNFELPDELLVALNTNEYINEFDKYIEKDESWEGIKDAYQSVYDLYIGENTLLDEKYISELRNIKASIKCNLSITINQKSWVFLALKGDMENSAKWFFIEEDEGIVYYELEKVVEKLREKLSLKNEWIIESKWIPKNTDQYLNKYLKVLQKNERQILPWKKKRALNVAEIILKKIRKKEQKTHKSKNKDSYYFERIEVINEMLKLLKPAEISEGYGVDYNQFANLWIDIFSKQLDFKREKNRNWRKVVSLEDFKIDFHDLDLSTEKLKEVLGKVAYKEQIWQNVMACIIAIPNDK